MLDLVPRIAHRPASNEYLVYDGPVVGVKSIRWAVPYCPAVSHVEYLPKYEHPIDCGVQKLTKGGSAIIANATMRVQIADPVRLRETLSSLTWDETLAMIARGIVCESLVSEAEVERAALASKIDGAFSFYGVELVDFRIEDEQEVLPLAVTQ